MSAGQEHASAAAILHFSRDEFLARSVRECSAFDDEGSHVAQPNEAQDVFQIGQLEIFQGAFQKPTGAREHKLDRTVFEQAHMLEGIVQSEVETRLHQQIDIVLQLVGQAEVPHRRRDHDFVMPGEVRND